MARQIASGMGTPPAALLEERIRRLENAVAELTRAVDALARRVAELTDTPPEHREPPPAAPHEPLPKPSPAASREPSSMAPHQPPHEPSPAASREPPYEASPESGHEPPRGPRRLRTAGEVPARRSSARPVAFEEKGEGRTVGDRAPRERQQPLRKRPEDRVPPLVQRDRLG